MWTTGAVVHRSCPQGFSTVGDCRERRPQTGSGGRSDHGPATREWRCGRGHGSGGDLAVLTPSSIIGREPCPRLHLCRSLASSTSWVAWNCPIRSPLQPPGGGGQVAAAVLVPPGTSRRLGCPALGVEGCGDLAGGAAAGRHVADDREGRLLGLRAAELAVEGSSRTAARRRRTRPTGPWPYGRCGAAARSSRGRTQPLRRASARSLPSARDLGRVQAVRDRVQVVRAIGVSRATLAKWARQGKITATQTLPNGDRRWRLSDLRAQLDELARRERDAD